MLVSHFIILVSTLICILLYKVYFKVEVYNLHLFKWATWVSVYFNLFYSTRFLKTHLEQWTNRLTFSAFYKFWLGLRSVRGVFFIALSLWFALTAVTGFEYTLDVSQLTAASALFSAENKEKARENLKGAGSMRAGVIAVLGSPGFSNDADSAFWGERGVLSVDLEPIMFAPGFCATDITHDMLVFYGNIFTGHIQSILPDRRIRCLLMYSGAEDIKNNPSFLANACFYIRPARPVEISAIKSVMLGTEGPQFKIGIREQICNAMVNGQYSGELVAILSEIEVIKNTGSGILLVNTRPAAFGPGYDASKLKKDMVVSLGKIYGGLIWDIRSNGDIRCFLIYDADSDLSKIPIAVEKENYLWVRPETAKGWSDERIKYTREELLQPLMDRWEL